MRFKGTRWNIYNEFMKCVRLYNMCAGRFGFHMVPYGSDMATDGWVPTSRGYSEGPSPNL